MRSISFRSAMRKFVLIVIGLVISYLLITLSEESRLTRFNLSLFGGPSWALWLYPFYLLFGFLISAFCFRSTKRTYVIIFCGFVVFFLILTFLSQGQIFDNWRPFGVDAY
jgi:hypothetical protein